jgi:hypothetical protein
LLCFEADVLLSSPVSCFLATTDLADADVEAEFAALEKEVAHEEAQTTAAAKPAAASSNNSGSASQANKSQQKATLQSLS